VPRGWAEALSPLPIGPKEAALAHGVRAAWSEPLISRTAKCSDVDEATLVDLGVVRCQRSSKQAGSD
jgi:hypothetical protein